MKFIIVSTTLLFFGLTSLATSSEILNDSSKDGSISSFAELDKECNHRIIFLPQTHPSIISGRLQVDPQYFEKTAQSQFSIAQYLANNKAIPIFSEQISSDTSMQTVSSDFLRLAESIRVMFPDGFPRHYVDLNEAQKNVIAKAGGDAISLIFGKIPLLHRVVENDQIQDDLFAQVTAWANENPYTAIYPPEIQEIIFNTREKLALDQINEYFRLNPSQRDVILIFGSDHSYSFRSHADKFSPSCILIPPEFQASMSSPYDMSLSYPTYTPRGESNEIR